MSWAFPYDHPGTSEMFIDVIIGNWNDEVYLVVPGVHALRLASLRLGAKLVRRTKTTGVEPSTQ